jgi:hypothetical protein
MWKEAAAVKMSMLVDFSGDTVVSEEHTASIFDLLKIGGR